MSVRVSDYSLSLCFLFAAVVCQALAAGLAFEFGIGRQPTMGRRGMWMMFALGTAALTLHSGHALQFSVDTAIYDLPQASLAMMAGILLILAIRQLRREFGAYSNTF